MFCDDPELKSSKCARVGVSSKAELSRSVAVKDRKSGICSVVPLKQSKELTSQSIVTTSSLNPKFPSTDI